MSLTQRKLATLLGVSQATVSLALRGDGSIPLATRERVLTAAREHGYFPNPQVSSLMRQVRAGEHGCLAMIVDAADEADWLSHPAYRQQYEGFRARATLRGYRAECFYLDEPGMSPRRVNGILTARGIVGMALMTPRRRNGLVLDFEWNRYAIVASGYTWSEPLVDRIVPHYRQHMEMAFERLETLGCRRIGFLLSGRIRHRVDKNWLVGWYLHEEKLPASRQVPRFSLGNDPSKFNAFCHWLRRWRVDGLLLQSSAEPERVRGWLARIGLSLPMVCLFHDETVQNHVDAMDERNDVIGTMLCDHLMAKLHHGELGLPEHPKLIMIAGGCRFAPSSPPAHRLPVERAGD